MGFPKEFFTLENPKHTITLINFSFSITFTLNITKECYTSCYILLKIKLKKKQDKMLTQ